MSSIIKGRIYKNTEAVITVGKTLKVEEASKKKLEESYSDEFTPVNFEKSAKSTPNSKADGETGKMMTNAKDEANQIINNAYAEANQILASANAEVEQLKNSTNEKIKEQTEQAQNQIQAQQDEAKLLCDNLINQAENEKQHILSQTEPEIVDLIIDLVGHIISHEMDSNSRWVKYLVKKILNNENITSNIEIGLPQTVYSKLDEEEFSQLENIVKGSKVVERLDMDGYTCIISTDNGDIIYNPQETLKKVTDDLKLLKQIGEKYDKS